MKTKPLKKTNKNNEIRAESYEEMTWRQFDEKLTNWLRKRGIYGRIEDKVI
jgi:hypothetical protein